MASVAPVGIPGVKSKAPKEGVYFDAAHKRGEIHGLKEELNHQSKEKKKDALKKVIQAMTNGSDVASLFPDVVNCMQTTDLPLKKLVYLYVINYAKGQPELAILAIHSFRKDANDPHNPLLRALAVRTMGCIRLDQMTEYLLEPLRKSCRDTDPYVRKTATICIAKLFDLSPQLVEEQGFIEILRQMLTDANPMVVANAVASLCEIQTTSRRTYLQLDETTISKLLPALNECTEWGQVFILDALAMYDPPNARVAEMILERGVIVRMSHANSAVVLSAVRVTMKFLVRIQAGGSPETVRQLCKKMTPPLVTLLSAEPEIQYVVMRNINLIVQKQPQILQQDVRMFVCKYNDPSYVKLEKISVMVQLASEKNIDQVLSEFREYASEVDIECVRRSVRAIGHSAIKLERAAERCLDVLLELIKTKVNYVVQEAIIVIKDIFRKYPGRYEKIISVLCENLENLDEPEAKASMIWIIGEYADRIENSNELLETFLDSFHEETVAVQQQLLTATVKLCLKCPTTSRELVQTVLKTATEDCNNPDLRDRGYMYWRLLTSNPEMAKRVLLTAKPPISDDGFGVQGRLLERLISQLCTLASVYHQTPDTFIVQNPHRAAREAVDEEDEIDINAIANETQMRQRQKYTEDSDEESDEGGSDKSSDDGEGGGGGSDVPQPLRPMSTVLNEQTPGQNQQRGLRIAANLVRGPRGMIAMQMMVGNFSNAPMSGFAIQFNKNSFGIAPAGQLQLQEVAPGGGTAQTTLTLQPNQAASLSGAPPAVPLFLEVAIKCNVDVFYLSVPYDLAIVLEADGPMAQAQFGNTWQQVPAERKVKAMGQMRQAVPFEMVIQRCKQYLMYMVHQREDQHAKYAYLSSSLSIGANKYTIYTELGIQHSGAGVQLVVTSESPALIPVFQGYIGDVLQAKFQPAGGA